MSAPNGYPSWVFNDLQPPVLVQNQEAFDALTGPGVWGDKPTGRLPGDRPVAPVTVVDFLQAINAKLDLALALLTPKPAPAPAAHANHESEAPKDTRRR